MGASSSAINPTQDFSPQKMGGGRLFDMGTSTVKYGISSERLLLSICIIQGGANELWQPGNEKIAGPPLSPVLAKPPIWSRELMVP